MNLSLIATKEARQLELKNIQKSVKNNFFSAKESLLKNITCIFPKGSTTVILGHNGAGKTTLLKIILGFIKKDSGTILFNGKPLLDKDRKSMGYISEKNILPLVLSPIELLRHHQKMMRQNPSYVQFKDVLTRINLWEVRNKPLFKISKGMQNRVAWGLVMLHQPQLIILDEPFSALDPLGRKVMLDWLEEESEKGSTIILSTHELFYLPKFINYVHIFQRGSLVKTYTALPNESEVLKFFI